MSMFGFVKKSFAFLLFVAFSCLPLRVHAHCYAFIILNTVYSQAFSFTNVKVKRLNYGH